MTTTMRYTKDTRFNQDTLTAIQETNKAAYAQRASKHDEDITKPADARGNYPRVFMHGAIVEVSGNSLFTFQRIRSSTRARLHTLCCYRTCYWLCILRIHGKASNIASGRACARG